MFHMNPTIFLDFFKCQIRSLSIEYSIYKSRQNKVKENDLIKRIYHLENSYASNLTPSLKNELIQCRSDLEAMIKEQKGSLCGHGLIGWRTVRKTLDIL